MDLNRSTTARPVPEPRPADTIPLRKVFLHVTKACNLHCQYCYSSASRPLPDEMTTEEFKHLWPELVALRPEKVIFTGGEPLLRPHVLELLRDLKLSDPRHEILRCLNTNGHLVTHELSRELVGLADEVRVSLDALATRNDTLRGAGNFETALQALDTFYAVGFEPKVLVTITAVSLPDLEDLLSLLIERHITRINLNVLRPIGRGKGHTEWIAPKEQVRAAVRRVWTRCFPDRLPPPEPLQAKACITCGVGRFLNILPNGDVYPCHVLTQREFLCGNIREQSLLDIYHRSSLLSRLAALDFRELAQQDERLIPLAQSDVCLGNMYATTRSLPVWRDKLPLRSLTPIHGERAQGFGNRSEAYGGKRSQAEQ